jgi:hypothetical protein
MATTRSRVDHRAPVFSGRGEGLPRVEGLRLALLTGRADEDFRRAGCAARPAGVRPAAGAVRAAAVAAVAVAVRRAAAWAGVRV